MSEIRTFNLNKEWSGLRTLRNSTISSRIEVPTIVIKTVDEVPFKINKNQEEFTLMRSSKIDLNRNVGSSSAKHNNSCDSGSFNGFPGLKPTNDYRNQKSMHDTSA